MASDKITPEDREAIEEAVYSVHMAADQVLNTDRVMYEKILDISISEAMHLLQSMKEELQTDERFENYKLHLFVPIQIQKLIQLRKGKENVEQP